MNQIVVDSSILIDFLRRSDKHLSPLVKILEEGYSLVISIVTHTELYSGKSIWEQESALKTMEELLAGFEIIPLSEPISQQAGKLKAFFGVPIFDSIIAATALTENLPLATLNEKHFRKVPKLKIILL